MAIYRTNIVMFLLIKALRQGPKTAVWPLTEGGRLNEAPLHMIHRDTGDNPDGDTNGHKPGYTTKN